MLKKLITAGMLLCATLSVALSMSANASLMRGIDGSFDIFGLGQTTLDAAGKITTVNFSFNTSDLRPQIILGDYQNYFDSNSIFSVTNPLILSDIHDVVLWEVEGFTFTGDRVRENKTEGTATGLYIIGTVSHADFIATETEWFFSTQGLIDDGTILKSFSSTITSPAPSQVPESATLALLSLGLMGFSFARKRRKS